MASPQIIYGIHAVMAALNHHPETVLTLYHSGQNNARLNDILSLAKTHHIAIEEMASNKLEKLSDSTQHQGIAAKIKVFPAKTEKDVYTWLEQNEAKAVILILEGIQDPHNLGACLRSAEALGVDWVIVPKANSAPINALVSKIACGATFTLPVVECANIVRFIEQIQKHDVWVVGTSGNATISLAQAALKRSLAIVMGTEDTGLKRLTLEKCDEIAKIPLVGSVESLNVSVATGITLYEVMRQRSS